MKKVVAILLLAYMLSFSCGIFAQSSVKVICTGQTTGHLVNLSLQTLDDSVLKLAPVTAYIPSTGCFQPYIRVLPETTNPPQNTIIVPLYGYYADVNLHPVPSGIDMTPVEEIPIAPVGDTIDLLPHAKLPFCYLDTQRVKSERIIF